MNEPVSSTAIRRALAGGEVARAATMLGRPFEARGTGSQRLLSCRCERRARGSHELGDAVVVDDDLVRHRVDQRDLGAGNNSAGGVINRSEQRHWRWRPGAERRDGQRYSQQ